MSTLLAVDGDSFAHRAYHALPKSIRLNAVVGFTNMLTRLWQAERPDAVLVAWDTLSVPTYRHEAFEPYQSGRVFEDSILEQLEILPEVVSAFGFLVAKAPGYEADDFLAAAAPRVGRRRARRDLRPRRLPARERPRDDPAADARRERARADRPRRGARALRRRAGAGAGSASRCAAIRPTSCRARAGSARRRPPRYSGNTARSRPRSPTDVSPPRRRT